MTYKPSAAVQISEPTCENPPDDEPCVRQFRAAHTRRLSGKPASQRGVDESGHPTSQRQQYYSEKLLAQVGEWLDREKKKLSSRSTKKSRSRDVSPRSAASTTGASPSGHQRSDSIESQSSQVSLDKLQHILEDTVNSMGLSTAALHHPRMPRVHRRKRTGSLARAAASSDSEYVDGDAIVPDCDVWVDNSKTLAYTGTQSEIGDDGRLQRDPEAWITFKNDILRTAHTLRLKGWRRVPLEAGETIGVQRLSGALTNAVYVVTPPADLPRQEGKSHPKTVLLRIYGPQVEHLIDREKELQILQRLARKRIGPRLLGTFRNGRFEQYFHASPLTPSDLRDPETSRQIAKRMRELHDGIELLPQEREAGPTVFRNFDQWLDNAGRIVRALDKQYEASLESANQRRESTVPCWKDNGYACGAPWDQFQDAVARCRAHLEKYYNDRGGLNDALVFAHNDVRLCYSVYTLPLHVTSATDKTTPPDAIRQHPALPARRRKVAAPAAG